MLEGAPTYHGRSWWMLYHLLSLVEESKELQLNAKW